MRVEHFARQMGDSDSKSGDDCHICYLISGVQLFYHMGNIRASLLNVDNRGDNAFVLRRLFLDMELGKIEGRKELAQIQATWAMGENEDAADAFRRIVAMFMTSRKGELRQTIQNSLFFKLGNFIGTDFATAVDEAEECMIPLPCIDCTTVEEALTSPLRSVSRRGSMLSMVYECDSEDIGDSFSKSCHWAARCCQRLYATPL
jgi:hypothetical protein